VAAVSSFREARATAVVADLNLQVATSFSLPFLLGIGLFSLLTSIGVRSYGVDFLSGVVASTSTIATLIAGFAISSMLFLGAYRIPPSLTYEQHVQFVQKIKYMIFSQVVTLLGAFLNVLFSGLAFAFSGAPDRLLNPTFLAAVAAGYFMFTLIRFGLLPLQIFELNESVLEDSIEDKTREVERNINRK
jgi:hypothetical protein